jgi:hypothetical protein
MEETLFQPPKVLAAIMRDVTKRFEEMRALKQKLAETTKP